MASAGVVIVLLFLVSICSASRLLPSDGNQNLKKRPIQTFRPYNIAHRGANGELPEESGPAYERAIKEGADFIESDIISTKDGFLICFHDLTLDAVTNIASQKEFAGRNRTYVVQGQNVTGFFTVDFTLDELKTLRLKQRYPFRDQQYNGRYHIITFDEFIVIALNASRVVGIYPEIKNPVFINQHVKWPDGERVEDVFVKTLIKYGYRGAYLTESWLKQPCFIQSFAPTSLIYASKLTDLPKILLIDDVNVPTQDTNQTYAEITSNKYLDYIKDYVDGIGPWKDTIDPPVNNYLQEPTHLIARAHVRNLQVHPYTFRNENQFLHFNFSQDPYLEYDYWINKMGVDGLFTDFTGSLHRYQDWTNPFPSDSQVNQDLLYQIYYMIYKMKEH